MSSNKKKKKLKNSHQVKSALKDKGPGIKGLSFYTSSERKRNKLPILSYLIRNGLFNAE